MALIEIERPKEWINLARSYGIYINGEKVGKIQHGEIKNFHVNPGTHVLRAKIDWCGSQNFKVDVANGETKILKLSSFKYAGLLITTTFGLMLLNLIIIYFLNLNSTGFIFLPFIVFLYFFYYITFGRNSYLRFTE